MPLWSGGSAAITQEPRPRVASLSPALEYIRPDTRLESLPSGWHLPENDIDRCLSFSRVRCVMSLISLCLLVTDIPRTGLGIEDVYQLFPKKAGPSMAIYFGPWAYPVAHIWRHAATSNSTTSSDATDSVVYEGKKGNSAIKTTTLWSYQYDSTSIGLRGIMELLKLPELYPDRLPRTRETSHGAPTAATLNLNATFHELDTLVSAIRSYVSEQLHDDNAHAQHQGYFAYATEHFWVDRLHHYLYRFTNTNTRWRIHSIHSYAKEIDSPSEALNICSALGRRRKPLFCEMPIEWKCSHPVNASLPKVPIWDHVDLRMAAVQRKYPGLALDLTIFTTYNPTTSSTSAFSAFFESEVLEIVTIMRGKNCSSPTPTSSANVTTASSRFGSDASSTACKTVFVDDYRYERGVLESNIAEWYPFTASLRAVAQFYVWVRLVLLFYVAYTASENLQQRTQFLHRVASTLRTMSKIPFQVVVYGSLFPVLSYVLAHVVDCSFVDLFLESYWTTVNGTSQFDLLTFARHASVQMRNVWIIALLMKIAVFFQTRVMLWRPHNGIHGVRGLAISLSSMLSVFGPYRSLSFRNSAIITVIALSSTMSDRGARVMEKVAARPISLFNISMEGLQKDMKMTLLAVCAVFAIALVAKLLLILLRPGYLSGVLFGSSIVVPYSAGVLWPTTALSVRFHVSVTTNPRVNYTMGLSRITPAAPGNVPASSHPSPSPNKQGTQQAHQSHSHNHQRYHPLVRLVWGNARTCVAYAFYGLVGIDRSAEKMFAQEHLSLHDHALRFEERTVEINSIVRLINIAMMTDPWTLFRLRVLGADVYFYESTIAHRQRQREESVSRRTASVNPNTGQPHHIFLLPCSPEKMLAWTGYGKDEYRLVGCMSSRDLPWSVLLQCG